MKRALLVCLALGFAASRAAAQPPVDAHLRVVVRGFESGEGQLLCRLFAEPSAFPRGDALLTATGRVGADGRATCLFSRVPRGWIALAVAHDRNGNGRLDANRLGIPREPIGFSGGAKPSLLGPPSFSAARVAWEGVDLALAIDLN